MTDSYPVLVYQVVGRQVSIGCSEGLLQRVPFERGHDILLCKGTGILLKIRHLMSVELGTTIPTCCSKAQVTALNMFDLQFCKLCNQGLEKITSRSPLALKLMTPSIAYLKHNLTLDLIVADKNFLIKMPKLNGGKAGSCSLKRFKPRNCSSAFTCSRCRKKLVSVNVPSDH